jgi:hypothetical protein
MSDAKAPILVDPCPCGTVATRRNRLPACSAHSHVLAVQLSPPCSQHGKMSECSHRYPQEEVEEEEEEEEDFIQAEQPS